MAVTSTYKRPFRLTDWVMELIVATVVVLLVGDVWLYMYLQDNKQEARKHAPAPTWLSLPKVSAQMTDGEMMQVKVALMLKKKSDKDELAPHAPAFQALVAEVGSEMGPKEITGPDGVTHFGDAIKSSVNDYLKEEGLKGRVKKVAFEELRLKP